jgi:hypothetical protein
MWASHNDGDEMKNTLRLMQEAAGDVAGVNFGELRSLLSKPSPENFLKLVPVMAAGFIDKNSKQFSDEVEPYVDSSLASWPASARVAPMALAIVKAMRSWNRYPWALKLIAKHVDSYVVWNETLKITEGGHANGTPEFNAQEVRYVSSSAFLNNLLGDEAIKRTKIKHAYFWQEFDLKNDELIRHLADMSLTTFEWLVDNMKLKPDEGALFNISRGDWGDLMNTKRISFNVFYKDVGLFEEHMNDTIRRGGGFDVLKIYLEGRWIDLREAQSIADDALERMGSSSKIVVVGGLRTQSTRDFWG